VASEPDGLRGGFRRGTLGGEGIAILLVEFLVHLASLVDEASDLGLPSVDVLKDRSPFLDALLELVRQPHRFLLRARGGGCEVGLRLRQMPHELETIREVGEGTRLEQRRPLRLEPLIRASGPLVQVGDRVIGARACAGCLFPGFIEALLGIGETDACEIELLHDHGEFVVERIQALLSVCNRLPAGGCRGE
jgi:hypothetical protein